MPISLTSPLTKETAQTLRAGDEVLITGTIYTARDAAHKRLCALLEEGKPLPFDPLDQIIYYVGPTPAPKGEVIGSAGPTTSGRMDAYSPALLGVGLRGMIGKGARSSIVVDAMIEQCGVYFAAIGGAGALLSTCIKERKVIVYEDLGAEALCMLKVENFPVVVVIDCIGNNLYESGPQAYLAANASS